MLKGLGFGTRSKGGGVAGGAGALIGASWIMAATLAVGCAGPVDYARPYPSDKAPGQPLNVQVFRHDNRLSLTNTSPKAFGPSTLWVNAAYSRPINGLDVGQTVEISLHEFYDEFQKAFRAGGFFATELPSPVVTAEIESDDRLYAFIVAEDVTD